MAAKWHIINGLTAKLRRAEVHIFNLKEIWKGFLDRGAYPVTSEHDVNTGYRIFKIANVAPIPIDVPLATGDAVHAIRTALDHLMYHLVSLHTRDPKVLKDAYFPICKNSEVFKARLKRIKEFLDPGVKKAIASTKAYRRGIGRAFWHLHQLDIIDKHKLLLTVGAVNRVHSMSPAEIARLRHQFLGVLQDIPEVNDARNFLKASSTPLFNPKIGSIIAILPEPEVHENMEFPFHVTFREPKVVKGKPVIEFLEQIRQKIYNMIMAFDASGFLE